MFIFPDKYNFEFVMKNIFEECEEWVRCEEWKNEQEQVKKSLTKLRNDFQTYSDKFNELLIKTLS